MDPRFFLLTALTTVIWPVMLQSETLIRFDKLVLEEAFYAEGAGYGDLNGDGKTDIVYGPYWYEGPEFKVRHTLYEPKAFSINGYSDNFFTYVEDINKDGFADILVLGFPGKEARLYLNPGKDLANVKVWPSHIVADVVDNESPDYIDLTGDGKAEIVCSRDGKFGYYTPADEDVTKPWKWHPISTPTGVQRFTHGLGVGDVNGDGRMDILEAKRWWQAPDKAGDTWQSHTFNLTGSGGAQMFAYDFNGDGRNDILTSLNAHEFGVSWFENKSGSNEGPNWQQHLITGGNVWDNPYGVRFSQPHALALVDLDGDGVKDFITGKRYWAHNGKDPNELDPRVLYWFQTKRGSDGTVEFIPHLIDSDTGVGTQLVTADLNGDGLVDVLVGNKYGCRVLFQKREEVDAERFAQFQPRKIYGEGSIKTADYQKGQTPQDAVKNMILPAGFKVDIIASEPNMVQPIAFCWDERGRLWVVEGNTYPKRAPEGEGKDRILIFEDTDGDGSFETRKIFKEGLNLVSGIEVGHGGVWVGAAPYFMFIPDTDGDDKPDGDPQVLLDGWGYQDTHETLNSFIWGPDGWLYGCHGVFTHSRVGKPGTADDQRIPLNAAIWRYHPQRRTFEIFAQGTSNPWGLDYNDKGEFFSTACVIPHLYHIIQGARYQRQAGQHFNPYTYDDIKTIAEHLHYAGSINNNAHWGDRKGKYNQSVPTDTDQAGGGHAHCGLTIYNGDNFPALYRGALLFGNLHGHRLVHNAVEPRGSGYTGQFRADFLRANDFWFIPVTQKVGPDGALYITDWSDKQVCHQNDPLVWDRGNGRMYRVVYDQLKPWKGDLRTASDKELFDHVLHATNGWFSRMAMKLLHERAVAKKLDEKWITEAVTLCLKSSKNANERLRAIWCADLLSESSFESVKSLALKDADEHVRGWSVRLIAGSLGEKAEAELSALARDEKSQVVRRQLASLLQRLPLNERQKLAEALLSHKEDEADHNIALLVWYGIEPLAGQDAATALQLARSSTWSKITGYIYRRMCTAHQGRETLLAEIISMKDQSLKEATLRMMVENARTATHLELPASWEQMAAALNKDASEAMQTDVKELAAYFRDEKALDVWRKQLEATTNRETERVHALEVLLRVRDGQTAKACQQVIAANQKPSTLKRRAIQALAVLADNENASVLTLHYSTFSDEEKADAVSALASTKEGATALLKAVSEGQIPKTVLSPFLIRQLQSFKNPQVDELVHHVWGTANAAKKDIEQQKAKWRSVLTANAIKNANLAEGKIIYAGVCGICHTLNGEGSRVGPDLTGSNRGNLDYLLENILDPNALIGKDYQLNIFSTHDGRVISGILKSDAGDAYLLVLPGGVEFSLAKSEVKSRELSKLSTMPEGLLDGIGEDHAVKLIAYLQAGAGGSSDRELFVMPDVLEGESLKATVSEGKIQIQGMRAFTGSRWSGDKQLWWTGGKPGDVLKLELPVAEAGSYLVKTAFTKAHDYGQFEIKLNGNVLHDGLDLYDAKVVTTGQLELGIHQLSAGTHLVEIRILGASSQATPRYMLGLDYIKLEKK